MTDVRDRFRRVDDLSPPELWPEVRRRAALPGGPPPWPEVSRTSRLTTALVAFLVFAAGGFLASRFLLPEEDEPTRVDGAADPWSEVGPGWTRLPDPPFARAGLATVWTGRELVVWGGTIDYDTRFFDDGAAYDPATRTWRSLAPSPLSPRADAEAFWTGSEVLFVGGYTAEGHEGNGAAYDPKTDAWRPMSLPPFDFETPAVSAWTGDRLFIWGSHIRDQEEHRGLLYDPAADAWEATAVGPLALNLANAVWTGEEVIVYGTELNNRNIASTRWAQGMAYDPAADSWRVLPQHHISPQATWANWTGTEMLVWDYETNSALFDPATGFWREPNRMPLRFSECYPYSVATAEIVYASFCGQVAEFDIGEDRWDEVELGPIDPTDPTESHVPIATSEVIVALIGRPDGGQDSSGEIREMWAYRPS